MFLDSSRFDGQITEKIYRECGASLSKIPLFISLFSLYFPPLQRLGKVGQVGKYSSCHMSTYYWLIWITSHPLSIIVDFHPLRRCHMSTWAPLGSPCLTNYAPDMWHTLRHSPYVKCPVCLEKREIQTVLEFDEIRRGS